MLLIGSQAMVHHGFNLGLGRQPQDYDYICTYEEYEEWLRRHGPSLHTDYGDVVKTHYPLSGNKFVAQLNSGVIFEFEIAWPGSTGEELLGLAMGETVASPGMLLALKLSHRYRKNSPHFHKTMDDIWTLRNAGILVPLSLDDWFKRREAETYNYPHPKLNQSKDGFFKGDGVRYVYDHDAIHMAVAQLGTPAYMRYREPGAQVMCSKVSFFEAPRTVQLFGVLEEAYVLALERSVIPHPGAMTPFDAFAYALKKVCTSITSGWFREFAWENYHQVVALYNDNYVHKFYNAVSEGKVPLHKEANVNVETPSIIA